MFVDPWGLELYLQGTYEEVKMMKNEISKLTNDRLTMEYIEETDKYIVKILRERDGNFVNGTKLVRNLIRGKYDCTVVITNGVNKIEYCNVENAQNGVGSDSIVWFNPNADPDILTVIDSHGNIAYRKRPSYIGLAHEFIHADHVMKGKAYPSIKEPYKYQIYTTEMPGNGIVRRGYQLDDIPMEELHTIGFKYVNDGDITENMIRTEHDLQKRGAYKGNE